ncbi:ATP-binding protein [Streptomyces sp. BK239]|uniref:ATP-binding protein n=1 Tax=Streptomyces sp. BK239 TaxID=2512155 RepID=UPI00102C0987|nr:ATP-binding protein [Streptomyces sp. BK239]RZU23973.1 signal transduction histidine kinase [Streptomyces sp. BK239]
MSTKPVDAPARPPGAASPVRRGRRGFADRWPFQRKLNVLVGVPMTVIALLLTYLVVNLVEESDRAESAARLVRDSAEVARLVTDLQAEHQQAILLSVRHEASFDGGTPSTSAYRVAQLAVDSQVQKVRDTFGGRLPAGEAQALREIEGLAGLRDTIEQGFLPADNIDPAYTGAADGLIDGLGLDRSSDLATTFTGNLLDSLLRADAAHGAFETGVFSARTGDSNALIEFMNAVGSAESYAYQSGRFARFATEAQTDELGGVEHNSSMAAIGRHYAELAVDPSVLQAGSKDELRAAFREALDSYHLYNQQASTRVEITGSLIGQIADRADDASTSAQWRAGLLLSLALLGFALWIALAVLVRRSVIRPVLALTGAAQEVADVAGRELARVADDDAEESGPPRLRELPVTADDEIGELAEAFNNVQTTAAALLERQVLSRRNVAEMFGNVGRRVSNLTTRQLALIDAVERGETDPALLERLYSIDHIAVRLRRNADSLMLLAGIREAVLDSGPSALTNVVRAALGQIEGFQRVRLHAGTEVMVEPDVIGDLTLMVAELLENAVSFSPEGSPVEVAVDSVDGGATITVADHGLGMSAERLAEENARLVRRERLDVVPTKVLGLFVVGALARRWDIAVTLSRTPGGGVTAEAVIPSALLLTPSGTSDAGTARALTGADPDAEAYGSLPAPSAPASGPSRALSVPAWAADDGEPAPLPRRVPRRDPASADETRPPHPAHARTSDPDLPDGTGTHGEEQVPAPTEAHEGAPAPAHTGTATHQAAPAPRTEAPRTARPQADHTAPAAATASTEARDPAPVPHPRTEGGTSGRPVRADRPAEPQPDGPRPLRRRVRGATLRTTADAAQQAARGPARPADADAVRSALEEFEAAVERAHRDTGEHPRPAVPAAIPVTEDTQDTQDTDHRNPAHRQNHLPEGAEQ